MPFIKVGTENSAPIELFYEDFGSGEPLFLIHGWPLNGASWEKQTQFFLDAGYRVIRYDRRGFGKSSQPSIGYDYDTFASDLNQIIEHLKLDHVSLAGFSMGSGEVTRYIGKYGTKKLKKVALLGVIPPYLLKTEGNPDGVDEKVFTEMKEALVADRPAFNQQFFDNFYNTKKLMGKKISEEAVHASWMVSMHASAIAAVKCVDSWLEDFREDLKKFENIPTLILHGTADQILPIKNTAQRLKEFLPKAKYVEIKNAPHGLLMTHAEEVNEALMDFFGPAEVQGFANRVVQDRTQLQ